MRKKDSGVYAFVNRTSGKFYIGSAMNLNARWNQHKTDLRRGVHVNPHLQASWNKYGGACFEFWVLERVSVDELLDREQSFIDRLEATNPKIGYNICPNARSSLGVKRSPQTKRKLRQTRLGSKLTQQTRAKISSSLKGHPSGMSGKSHSKEARDKISASLQGQSKTKEHRRNIGKALQGREVSKEHREKIRSSLRGRKASVETRRKMSESHTGKAHPQKSRLTEYWVLKCVECGQSFERKARIERHRRKKGGGGPYCSVRCRNTGAARNREVL